MGTGQHRHWAACDGHPVATLMRLREEAAAKIDRLLAFLDATDGDPELELDAGDEGEEENEHLDTADDEPLLGWCKGMAQGQGRWGDSSNREAS